MRAYEASNLMWVHPVRFGGLKPYKNTGFGALEAPGLTKTMVWELSKLLDL